MVLPPSEEALLTKNRNKKARSKKKMLPPPSSSDNASSDELEKPSKSTSASFSSSKKVWETKESVVTKLIDSLIGPINQASKLLELLATVQLKIYQLKDVLSARGVECSIQSVNTSILKIEV